MDFVEHFGIRTLKQKDHTHFQAMLTSFVEEFDDVYDQSSYDFSKTQLTRCIIVLGSLVTDYADSKDAQLLDGAQQAVFIRGCLSSIKILCRTYRIDTMSNLYIPSFFYALIDIILRCKDVEKQGLKLEALRVLQNLVIIQPEEATSLLLTDKSKVKGCIIGLLYTLQRVEVVDNVQVVQSIQACARILTFQSADMKLHSRLLEYGLVPMCYLSLLKVLRPNGQYKLDQLKQKPVFCAAFEIIRLLTVTSANTPHSIDLTKYDTTGDADSVMFKFESDVMDANEIVPTLSSSNLHTLMHEFALLSCSILCLNIDAKTLTGPDSAVDAVHPNIANLAVHLSEELRAGITSGVYGTMDSRYANIDVEREKVPCIQLCTKLGLPEINPTQNTIEYLKMHLTGLLQYFPFTHPEIVACFGLHAPSQVFLFQCFVLCIDTLVPPGPNDVQTPPECWLRREQQQLQLQPLLCTLVTTLENSPLFQMGLFQLLFAPLDVNSVPDSVENAMLPYGAKSELELDGTSNSSLRARTLMAMQHATDELAGCIQECVYLACQKNTKVFVYVCGFGRAVGLLANKGLPGFAGFLQSAVSVDSLLLAKKGLED